MGTRGAGGRAGQIGSGCAIANRDLSGGEVGDGGGDKEGRDPVWAGRELFTVFTLDDFEGADATAHVYSDLFGILHRHVKPGLFHGKL